jgi:hypothetical protein
MSWERSGIPGGYTGTDWRRHDVTSMWQAVEDQHTDGHWKLVSGWRRTAELTSTHLSRLEQYRANLIAAWPPDRNAAAAAYVSRLDFLIQNVRTTHEVAVANYTTFGATVGALAGAQRDLKPLHDEYIRTLQTIRDHEALVAHNAASEAVSTVGRPPATRADLEVLNNRARAIMFSLSHTLIEAEAALKHPPTYMPHTTIDWGNPDIYGSGTAKPDRPSQPSSRAGIKNTREAKNLAAPGASRTTPMPRPAAGRLINPSTPSIGRASSPTIASTSKETQRKSDQSKARGPVLPGSNRGTLSPEGVIGRTPTVGNAVDDARTPSRVNPIGGVVGSSTAPPGVFASRDTSSRRDREHNLRLRSDLDAYWESPRGVAPVIHPPSEVGLVDPGPAIGL